MYLLCESIVSVNNTENERWFHLKYFCKWNWNRFNWNMSFLWFLSDLKWRESWWKSIKKTCLKCSISSIDSNYCVLDSKRVTKTVRNNFWRNWCHLCHTSKYFWEKWIENRSVSQFEQSWNDNDLRKFEREIVFYNIRMHWLLLIKKWTL